MKFPFGRKNDRDDEMNNSRYGDEGFYRGDEDEDEGIVEDDLVEDENAEELPPPARRAAGGTLGGNIKTVKPRDPSEGQDIADYLMQGYIVVMNIDELERGDTVKLISFLMGALHVLGGEMRRMGDVTIILSPRKDSISGEER